MSLWLLLSADLRFNSELKAIFPKDYRADLLPEGSNVYYGVHFVSAPTSINPGDHVIVELLLRAFPIDPCIAFQVGKKISLKEGPLTRAEGTISRRWEHETPARTIVELQQERGSDILQ